MSISFQFQQQDNANDAFDFFDCLIIDFFNEKNEGENLMDIICNKYS